MHSSPADLRGVHEMLDEPAGYSFGIGWTISTSRSRSGA